MGDKITRTPDLQRVTEIGNVTEEGIVINYTDTEAFLVTQFDDAGDVFAVRSDDPSGQYGVQLVKFRANGGNDITATGTVSLFDARMWLGGSYSHSGRVRTTDFRVIGHDGVTHTGIDADEMRAFSTSLNWASSGTLSFGVGMNTAAFVGGGSNVDAGFVNVIVCHRVHTGFQGKAGTGDGNTPNTGEINYAYGMRIIHPNDVSVAGSHPINNLFGIDIERIDLVSDIGDAWGIRVQNHVGHTAIETEQGTVKFGDEVQITGSQDTTQLLVKGHTTQGSPIADFQTSGGTPILEVYNTYTAANSAFIAEALLWAKQHVIYEPSSTTNVVAGVLLEPSQQYMRVQGSGGAVTVTATPSIDTGSDGQMLILEGRSDTNTLTYQDESNLAGSTMRLEGGVDLVLGLNDTATFIFNEGDDLWIELSRCIKI